MSSVSMISLSSRLYRVCDIAHKTQPTSTIIAMISRHTEKCFCFGDNKFSRGNNNSQSIARFASSVRRHGPSSRPLIAHSAGVQSLKILVRNVAAQYSLLTAIRRDWFACESFAFVRKIYDRTDRQKVPKTPRGRDDDNSNGMFPSPVD